MVGMYQRRDPYTTAASGKSLAGEPADRHNRDRGFFFEDRRLIGRLGGVFSVALRGAVHRQVTNPVRPVPNFNVVVGLDHAGK
jgi:hypothetical protein